MCHSPGEGAPTTETEFTEEYRFQFGSRLFFPHTDDYEELMAEKLLYPLFTRGFKLIEPENEWAPVAFAGRYPNEPSIEYVYAPQDDEGFIWKVTMGQEPDTYLADQQMSDDDLLGGEDDPGSGGSPVLA